MALYWGKCTAFLYIKLNAACRAEITTVESRMFLTSGLEAHSYVLHPQPLHMTPGSLLCFYFTIVYVSSKLYIHIFGEEK